MSAAKKNKKLSLQDIKDIKDSISAIDSSIFSLMMKRSAYFEDLIKNIHTNFATSFYDILDIIKVLTLENKDKLPVPSIVKIWSEVITAAFLKAKPFDILYLDPTANQEVINLIINDNFSNLIAKKEFNDSGKLLDFLDKNNNDIAVIPRMKSMSDSWWYNMAANYKNIFIFAKFFGGRKTDSEDEFFGYALGEVDNFNYENYERLVAVFETSFPISKDMLKKFLIELDVPVYKILDMLAVYSGKCVYLVEINNNFDDISSLENFKEEINNIEINNFKIIGGYSSFLRSNDDKVAIINLK